MKATFDWRVLIALAEQILQLSFENIDNEFVYRTVINRAYYGSHGHASLNLEFKGTPVPKDHKAHSFVILSYKKSKNVEARTAGMRLSTLMRFRADADYDIRGYTKTIDLGYSKALCERLIADSKDICKLVDASKV